MALAMSYEQVLSKSQSVIDGLKKQPAGILTAPAAELLIKRCYQKGLPIRLTDGYRSMAEQNRIYNQGRTPESKAKGEKIVSNAVPGTSLHNYALAIDIVFISTGYNFYADFNQNSIADIVEVVTQAKLIGWKWGGDFHSIIDRPHFEFNFGLTGRMMLNGQRWTKAQMDAAIAKVNLVAGAKDEQSQEGQAMTKDEQVKFEEMAKKVETQGQAIEALNKKVNISGNQTPPKWAEPLLEKAKKIGAITTSNDKGQPFFETLAVLDNLGLLDGEKQ